MTEAEQHAMMALVNAWNLFVRLPIEHPDDSDAMRAIIHAAQAQIFKRAARREFNSEFLP